MIRKYRNNEVPKRRRVIQALLAIFDNLVYLLSFGTYYGDFSYEYLTKKILFLDEK